MKITALIPARLNSSRFNGKLMMDLCGKPVITRTYDAALATNLFSSVIVVTEDYEIHDEIISNNGNSILIKKEYNSTETGQIFETNLNQYKIVYDKTFVQSGKYRSFIVIKYSLET